MNKELIVWCVNGRDDDGVWDVEIYSTYEKAKKSFDYYVNDYNAFYGEQNESSVCEIDGDYARYDCDCDYVEFWIEKVRVR